jgi:prune family protein 2
LLYSEDKTLESAVVKVINPVEQNDAEVELRESSSSLVLKELLQEAPELITEQLAHLLRGEPWLFLLNTGRRNGVALTLLV